MNVPLACMPLCVQLSKRINVTDTPVIAFTRRAMALRPDTVSLAQGIVYWPPPPEATAAAAAALADPATAAAVSSYGPNEGLPELRSALKAKVAERNGLPGHNICVTHGGNQAFVNLALTLVDECDRVVLFRPAYFDHIMTITQTGGADNIVWGECNPHTLHPCLTWLRGVMASERPPRLVVICNPCNPTGVLLTRSELDEMAAVCGAAGAWLVVDSTYEDFVWGYDDGNRNADSCGTDAAAGTCDSSKDSGPVAEHYCPCAPHVVHIFSFSKAYGMMGWRVGYVAYWDPDGTDVTGIGGGLLKCQDTVCICAGQLAQRVALAALQQGDSYKKEKIESLRGNRALLLDALSPLGSFGSGAVAGGEGGLYYWARLPESCKGDDTTAVEWLVRHAGVCLVPGSSCGAPGYVRASFGNLPPERMREAAVRLKAGLTKLVAHGMVD